MKPWDVESLERTLGAAGGPYHEFLRTDDLSAGLYVLPAGGEDRQQPHGEDELYHVVRGRSAMVVGDDRFDVGPGSLVFVAARVPHRFVEIEEDLVVLVVFGPAEGARLPLAGASG
jgi:mannose-6-phosphate isomerase-like protein (cupin superfamily)